MPVAGQTLVEHQARMARAAGAGHIVVLVDQMPAELVAAFDRLRADGLNIDIARDVRDAADRIHPDEQLLVLADGVVIDRDLATVLASSKANTLFTLPDGAETARYERIDAADRWAGVALINGKMLRDTVSMLGDWTLAPTLLRTALQQGAVRMPVPELVVHGLVNEVADAHGLSNRLAERAALGDGGAIRRMIAAPVARFVVPWLLGLGVPLDLVVILPLVFAVSGLLLAAIGWQATGLLLLLLAFLPATAAAVIAASSARSAGPLIVFERLRMPLFWAIILLAGWSQYDAGTGWGALVVALWAVIKLALPQRPLVGRFDADYALLVMLVALCLGQPLAGMALIIAASIANDMLNRIRPT
jgi:hypothetical protein